MKRKKGVRTVFHSYDECSEYEKKKVSQGFRRLGEYECYYLYGKFDVNNNLLYKECFSKFDIDGIPERKRIKNPRKLCSRGKWSY